MSKCKLTVKAVENAKPKDKEYLLPDGGGLNLRVRPTGGKSWVFRYRRPFDNMQSKLIVGALRDMSLKEARDKASSYRKLLDEGIDPQQHRAALIAENTQAMTMGRLFEAWVSNLQVGGSVSDNWVKRHKDRWRLHLQAKLQAILARDITRAHLAGALDAMTAKGIKEETRKALTTLNLMLDYAVSRQIVDQNLARLLKPKDFAATANKPKERALNTEELRKLWLTLDYAVQPKSRLAKTATLGHETAAAIKLIILTGARRSEVAKLRWDQLDFKAKTWTLRENKSNRTHIVYLSQLAIELIQAIPKQNSDFVFCSQQNPKTHIHPDGLTRALSRLQTPRSVSLDGNQLPGVEHFTLHDLRRSAATAWAEKLKVDPHIIERMLNHQPQNKLIRTYQRAEYVSEQRSAWTEWGRLVKRLITSNAQRVALIGKQPIAHEG